MKSNGSLVISLDFELLWGIFDKVNYKDTYNYFENTKMVIPEILKLFQNYEISCTWATVGMLFNDDWKEWEFNIPKTIPQYHNNALSPYLFGNSIISRSTEKICFAPDLIEKIKSAPLQEIGTHTYSHYYCLEAGQTIRSFKSDLDKAVLLGDKFNIPIETLVFPRNQMNSKYLEVCRKNGIKMVRSNPDNWYWENPEKNGFFQKICRTGDAYLGLQDKTFDTKSITVKNGLSSMKASRLLRPYSSNSFINDLKLKRIKSEMRYAAKNKKVYHLWWHPHNFGKNPDENLKDLEILLKYYTNLNKKYSFSSASMKDLA